MFNQTDYFICLNVWAMEPSNQKKTMKTFTISLFALLVGATLSAQTPCVGGSANGFPCNGYDLLAKLLPSQMAAGDGNDSWGWTDPQDGKEYAIVGLDNGTAFIDISDPVNVVYLGKLPTHTTPSIWRDIKVYNNHAFVVSEAGGHGMQVFDLTRLRDVTNPPETFTEDAHYGAFGNCHNIAINEETGYAYAIGTSLHNGGPHIIDISDPLNPMMAGAYDGSGYTHDAQIIVYDGPDADHIGDEIFFGSNEDQLVIVDVTNKANPQLLSTINYASVAYTHQAWLTEDRNYILIGDELDESDFGFNTRTVVGDVSDLDNPSWAFDYFGTIASIDHNGYVKGDKFYLSNYSGGMRVIDISDIANENMSEIGYFDTYPANNNVNFGGSWNVYPFFESGNIVISGGGGFTLVRESNLGIGEDSVDGFSMAPNPANQNVVLRSEQTPLEAVQIYNMLGQQVLDMTFDNTQSETINISQLTAGMYVVTINGSTTQRLMVN